jgi:hypothetical protein
MMIFIQVATFLFFLSRRSVAIELKPYDKSIAKQKKYETFCFHDNEAGERGTQVAMFDYAEYSEKYFNVKSKIFFANDSSRLHAKPLKHFQDRFPVILYEMEEPQSKPVGGRFMLEALLREGCDFLYVIKAGGIGSQPSLENLSPEVVPMGIHAVFDWEPHLSSYAAISPEVAKKQHRNSAAIPSPMIVPHIVRPVEDWSAYLQIPDLRKSLNISSEALVICRHGGFKTFDISFVHRAIQELLVSSSPSFPDLHFLFVNTKQFPNYLPHPLTELFHQRFHFLPMIVDLQEKEKYYRTCNAMLHARNVGETFGLSIAEMSVRNIPVMTSPGTEQEHIRILGKKGFVYHSGQELKKQIEQFYSRKNYWIDLTTNRKEGRPKKDSEDDFNAYRDYEPEKVMKIFKKYFLDPIFQ